MLCNSPTTQLCVLDITSDGLLLQTATGTGSLSPLRHDVCRTKEAVGQSSPFVVFLSFRSSISCCLTVQAVKPRGLCPWVHKQFATSVYIYVCIYIYIYIFYYPLLNAWILNCCQMSPEKTGSHQAGNLLLFIWYHSLLLLLHVTGLVSQPWGIMSLMGDLYAI